MRAARGTSHKTHVSYLNGPHIANEIVAKQTAFALNAKQIHERIIEVVGSSDVDK